MRSALLVVGLLIAAPTTAQEPSPYAGQQGREIKALSQSEIEEYLSGEGMGLAKAAELNGYPGPRHVLDLDGELSLTPGQREESQGIFERMHAEAVRLGGIIVEKEGALDRAFAQGTIERPGLMAAVQEIGRLQASLRLVHLTAHLEQRRLLDDAQLAAYRKHRGYGEGAAGHRNDHH